MATPGPDALLPGLGEDGVYGPERLAERHRTSLANASFVRVATERIGPEDRPHGWARTRTSVAENRLRYRFRVEANSGPAYSIGASDHRLDIYYHGAASYLRDTTGDAARYRRIPG